jgi:hypothetical protein
MIKDLSWLKISDGFAPNIRQISWNIISIYQYPHIRIWVAATVPVPGTCTCSKISKYPNIRSANPLIFCKMLISWYKDLAESTNLQQNREISDIRIDYKISEWCSECTKYPKIFSRISAGALSGNVPSFVLFNSTVSRCDITHQRSLIQVMF